LYPPGNGGCGGKIQEKNSLLVHDPKLQTMIESTILANVANFCDWKMSRLEVQHFL
jgi:hypothetical protein